ncbi:hypothetical protein GCM10022414_36020 [Zhongshania borealis]|uniref:Uncharacterized protein n=1 Tax=Zhongshania borealis TaxID=889488 RepID=A0ABP7X6Z4_9GAMM
MSGAAEIDTLGQVPVRPDNKLQAAFAGLLNTNPSMIANTGKTEACFPILNKFTVLATLVVLLKLFGVRQDDHSAPILLGLIHFLSNELVM